MQVEFTPTEERLDVVNDGVRLIQRKEGLTFGTDALLLAGYVQGRGKICAELGGGTGIISLLLVSRQKAKRVYVYEIQERYAELIRRNAGLNGMEEEIRVVCSDIREASSEDTSGEVDIVFSNPPYMRKGSGRVNLHDEKTVARHEVFGDIEDFCRAGSRLLKYGGDFYVVYPPDRLAELFDGMKKNAVEPKRMTLIYPDESHRPCLVLVMGKKGGKAGMTLTPPFFIKRGGASSTEYQYVMDHGDFDELYKKV